MQPNYPSHCGGWQHIHKQLLRLPPILFDVTDSNDDKRVQPVIKHTRQKIETTVSAVKRKPNIRSSTDSVGFLRNASKAIASHIIVRFIVRYS